MLYSFVRITFICASLVYYFILKDANLSFVLGNIVFIKINSEKKLSHLSDVKPKTGGPITQPTNSMLRRRVL